LKKTLRHTSGGIKILKKLLKFFISGKILIMDELSERETDISRNRSRSRSGGLVKKPIESGI